MTQEPVSQHTEEWLRGRNVGVGTNAIVSRVGVSGDLEYLVVQRRWKKKDHWGLPGGGVDAGESAARAVVRHLTAKLGVSVELGPWRGTDFVPQEIGEDGEVVRSDRYNWLYEVGLPKGAELALPVSTAYSEWRWVTAAGAQELFTGTSLARFNALVDAVLEDQIVDLVDGEPMSVGAA